MRRRETRCCLLCLCWGRFAKADVPSRAPGGRPERCEVLLARRCVAYGPLRNAAGRAVACGGSSRGDDGRLRQARPTVDSDGGGSGGEGGRLVVGAVRRPAGGPRLRSFADRNACPRAATSLRRGFPASLGRGRVRRAVRGRGALVLPCQTMQTTARQFSSSIPARVLRGSMMTRAWHCLPRHGGGAAAASRLSRGY